MKQSILFFTTILFSTLLSAQTFTNKPLEVGSDAPLIKGKNQNKETINSNKIIKDGPIVLVFYRGEWCGYCKRHLSHLQDSLDLISEKGASVIVVTPEQPKYVLKTVKKTHAKYSIISDKDFSIMKAYNVHYEVNDSTVPKWKSYVDNVTAKQNNNGEAVLPIPATYIIDSNGKIKWYHFDPEYDKRSTVKDILSNI